MPLFHNNFKKIERSILSSKMDVIVSASTYYQPANLQDLINKAKDQQKTIIFTHTAGPLLEEIVDNSNEGKKPETKYKLSQEDKIQLLGFNEEASHLTAVIYAVNRLPINKQAGAAGVLAQEKMDNIFMLSDSDNKWEKNFNLPTTELNNQKGFKPFSLVITPNGKVKAFAIESNLTEEKMQYHMGDIYRHICLQKTEDHCCMPSF